ncbi:unnamed protein product [Rotaria sp. Silwood2]|nr:unnamed protein product [Rotaria sp. Silwood2]CAF3034932.1 unnamed protein product [Rotaria sp. Silwood2]CAF3969807.1 unnamed protein product [Rotaria sp. Silwood2]CAF4033851.1 unnamed protein product [Rotaria sp. Silwood2]
MTILLQSYRFRLKTAPETFTQQKNNVSNSNTLLIYFKGEQGLTQTLLIPLSKLNEDIYENKFQLLDVGNLLLAHVKLDANNIRWKLNWIELERDNQNGEKNIFNFPINRWLDSNQNKKLDIFIKEGPAQFAPIYTIIIRTGTISSCSQANIHLALIGDGASTIPFDLNSNSSLIQCTMKNLFQSGSKDIFYISSFESVDIGQLFRLQVQCDSRDNLPYYCESIEVINNLTDEKYFFLVNHWFGPNLEQKISIPVIDRKKESNLFTISIKTTDISNSDSENMIYIQMNFVNGKSYEEVLSSSETHKIPFQKDNIDFFLVVIDNIGDTEINDVKVCFVNKSTEKTMQTQWKCAWIEIRDIFYQRNYW